MMLEDKQFERDMSKAIKVSPIACPYCLTVSETWEEAKQHDGECVGHPGNIRAAALQVKLDRALAKIAARASEAKADGPEFSPKRED